LLQYTMKNKVITPSKNAAPRRAARGGPPPPPSYATAPFLSLLFTLKIWNEPYSAENRTKDAYFLRLVGDHHSSEPTFVMLNMKHDRIAISIRT